MLAVCPALVIAAMSAGTFAGLWLAGPAAGSAPPPRLVWKLAAGLWAVLACWGGVSLVIGTASRRRAVAAGVAGGSAAALMLVDYLSRVWKPIRPIARLSPFHYYNPLDLVMGKPLPPGDLGILLGTAAAAIALAFVVFRRRDI
jgi:ABC-type transport system involved in multi-copper enzyme maturation permease subunit